MKTTVLMHDMFENSYNSSTAAYGAESSRSW